MIRLSRYAMSAVMGAVLLAGASSAASAHVMGGGHGFGGHGGHHGHGFRGGYFIGFDDDYGYGGGCSYLRHKAHETGRPYWWRRYEACLDG